jgi:hypothetical protein
LGDTKERAEFGSRTLTGRIEDDAAASPCQGEAITTVVGTPVEILRYAQDDTKKGKGGNQNTVRGVEPFKGSTDVFL